MENTYTVEFYSNNNIVNRMLGLSGSRVYEYIVIEDSKLYNICTNIEEEFSFNLIKDHIPFTNPLEDIKYNRL